MAAVLLVLGAALTGFLGYRTWQRHQLPATQLLVTRSHSAPDSPVPANAANAAAPTQATPPPVPDTVPDLQMPDASGNLKSLRGYLGHPLIINFWATWCAPCRREIPLLLQLRVSYRSEGLEIVGIAVDFREAVTDYLKRTPISYPLLIGEDQGLAAAQTFGMEPVLPFSVFADSKGQIIAVKIGELHQDEADYILQTMRLIGSGQQSLPEARAGIAERLRALAVERAKGGGNNNS